MEKQYYIVLINRIYKILPLFEENMDNFKKYIQTLYVELSGNKDFQEIVQIKYKIKGLVELEANHEMVRRTVFECISILDRLITMLGVDDFAK